MPPAGRLSGARTAEQQEQCSWCGVAGHGGGGGGREVGEREGLEGGVGVGEGGLVEEDATLDGLAADGALAHSVAAQLAGAVAAQEDHVLQPVQAHRAHGLTDGGTDGQTDRWKRRGVTVMSAKRGKETVTVETL